MINNQTIKELDVERYMGTWYELAHFNHRFEKGLVGVTATYTLHDNGKIQVVNAGYKNTLDGKYSKANAKAKIPNTAEPGKLKVYFVPFFGADYYILDIDPDYQWVLVGSSSPNYLWILSRTPNLPETTYQMILGKAKSRGYATDALIRVEH
jgi:lipocalin